MVWSPFDPFTDKQKPMSRYAASVTDAGQMVQKAYEAGAEKYWTTIPGIEPVAQSVYARRGDALKEIPLSEVQPTDWPTRMVRDAVYAKWTNSAECRHLLVSIDLQFCDKRDTHDRIGSLVAGAILDREVDQVELSIYGGTSQERFALACFIEDMNEIRDLRALNTVELDPHLDPKEM